MFLTGYKHLLQSAGDIMLSVSDPRSASVRCTWLIRLRKAHPRNESGGLNTPPESKSLPVGTLLGIKAFLELALAE